MLPTFLNLLQELFNGVLAIGSYIRLINEAVKSSIDPKLLLVVALQVLGLVDKENKEEARQEAKEEAKEEVDKAFKLELAYSFIKGS